ncbi:MAG: hypothetical protein SOX11_11860 [Lachnospiraceae bacterium]|nr:hypothetical protein [Lachnospiraceae bacterium]MDY3223823.1 hypothetical protein [Lachnospiraceae bacterium]
MNTRTKKDYIAGYSYAEWEKLEKEFKADLNNSRKYNKSFSELINAILEGETQSSFADKTGLSETMLSRLRNRVDEKDPPAKKTVVTVCIAYHLDLMMTLALLHSVGSDFNPHNKRDYAYAYLLTRCRDKSVDECNEILKELEIEEKYWLGTYARNIISSKQAK